MEWISIPIKGSYSATIPNNSTGYLDENFSSVNDLYLSFYVRAASFPATARLVQLRNGSTTVGSLYLNSDGTLTLKNNSTTIGSASAALSINTLYRIGIHQRSGSGTGVLEAYLTTGDAAFGTPFASSSAQTISGSASEIRLGATNGNAVNLTVDNLRLDSGSLPGPLALVQAQAQANQPADAPPPPAVLPTTTRTIAYSYDGLQRLVGAVESPGASYSYTYDLAGNRTDGGKTYDAANQITNAGYSYDAAGNLTNDGTTTYGYDALNRTLTRGGTAYTYNGDGVLVFDGSTRFTQDLASPLSQVLQTTQGSVTTQYLYGQERLASLSGSTRTWYGIDALGSVRQTLDDVGTPLTTIQYDPWGSVESGSVPTFGFTGEVQQGGDVYLRARWYNATRGTFTTRDPFDGMPETPYSLMPYQYAYADPVRNSDASGAVVASEPGGGISREACIAIGWQWVVYQPDLQAPSQGHCIPKPPPPSNDVPKPAYPQQRYPRDGDPESGQRIPRPRASTVTDEEACTLVETDYICLSETSHSTKNAARILLVLCAARVAGSAMAPAIPQDQSSTPKPAYIYRSGQDKPKTLSLHRSVDWATGLSFFDHQPAGSYIKFKVTDLEAAGYIVRPDGGTIVYELWGGPAVMDPQTGQPRSFGSGHVTVYHSSRDYWNQWYLADLANKGTPNVSPQLQAIYALHIPS